MPTFSSRLRAHWRERHTPVMRAARRNQNLMALLRALAAEGLDPEELIEQYPEVGREAILEYYTMAKAQGYQWESHYKGYRWSRESYWHRVQSRISPLAERVCFR